MGDNYTQIISPDLNELVAAARVTVGEADLDRYVALWGPWEMFKWAFVSGYNHSLKLAEQAGKETKQ